VKWVVGYVGPPEQARSWCGKDNDVRLVRGTKDNILDRVRNAEYPGTAIVMIVGVGSAGPDVLRLCDRQVDHFAAVDSGFSPPPEPADCSGPTYWFFENDERPADWNPSSLQDKTTTIPLNVLWTMNDYGD
jgi:hypothetical protein